jgi:hypothetical protein
MMDEWVNLKRKIKVKKSRREKLDQTTKGNSGGQKKVNDSRGKKGCRKKKRSQKEKKKTVRGQFFEPFLGLSFIFSANASLGVAFFDFFFSAGGSSGASTGAARPCKITKGTSRGSEAKSTKLPISRRRLYLFLHWGLLWRRSVLRT